MRTRTVSIAAIAVTALLGLSACTQGEEEPDSSVKRPVGGQQVTVKVAETDIGKILVDQSGRTLYGFTKDKEGASACSESCIAVWPALVADKDPEAGSGTDGKLFELIDRAEGARQVSYKDWPLYYYAGDVVPGDLNGQGLDEEWFAVAPDGSLVK
ncbi:hypothetical protein ACH4C6_34155 [Streptomyces sp. NPDC017943]|uniref:hypothetical protein n=1 Tax=Streptomyces sp. NPDC017943 TaxID=3365019 RepID=UPI0037876916